VAASFSPSATAMASFSPSSAATGTRRHH
jgi:hypothetical protein